MSDIDKDGQLTCEEFSIAMFLVEKAIKGIPPPVTLPQELLPKGGGNRSPSLSGDFEGKRKENFEKGRAELERRRKMVEETAQKERVKGN